MRLYFLGLATLPRKLIPSAGRAGRGRDFVHPASSNKSATSKLTLRVMMPLDPSLTLRVMMSSIVTRRVSEGCRVAARRMRSNRGRPRAYPSALAAQSINGVVRPIEGVRQFLLPKCDRSARLRRRENRGGPVQTILSANPRGPELCPRKGYHDPYTI